MRSSAAVSTRAGWRCDSRASKAIGRTRTPAKRIRSTRCAHSSPARAACSRALPDDRLQPGGVGAAGGEPRAILQSDDVFAVTVGREAVDLLEVHYRRSMDAREDAWIEARFELAERLPQQVMLAAGVKAHVVALGVVPFDIVGAHEIQVARATDQKFSGVRALCAQGLEEVEQTRIDVAGIRTTRA